MLAKYPFLRQKPQDQIVRQQYLERFWDKRKGGRPLQVDMAK